MLFPHPSASKAASGFMLVTRCLPRGSDELASMTATLGSFYWLGFETSGLSPDKKRLAWLGAQQRYSPRIISPHRAFPATLPRNELYGGPIYEEADEVDLGVDRRCGAHRILACWVRHVFDW